MGLLVGSSPNAVVGEVRLLHYILGRWAEWRPAARAAHPRSLRGSRPPGVWDRAPRPSPNDGVLREVVDEYLKSSGVDLKPSHYIDNFAVGISLVTSTRGVALLPTYVEPLLP